MYSIAVNMHLYTLSCTAAPAASVLLKPGTEAAWKAAGVPQRAFAQRGSVRLHKADDSGTRYLQPLLCKGFTNQARAGSTYNAV